MHAQEQSQGRTLGGLTGLMLLTVLGVTPSLAQDAELLAAGKREFRRACVVCHGLSGHGESVMTTFNLLTVRPPDLTQLSKRHQGQFPFWQVYRIVDGREVVRGHGEREMPLWGDVFVRQEGDRLADETQAIGRILQLVYYLQSIQAP